MRTDPTLLTVGAIGAVLLAVLLAGALRMSPGDPTTTRMDQCLAAGASYQAEFGWDPDGGIRTWCEHNITGRQSP